MPPCPLRLHQGNWPLRRPRARGPSAKPRQLRPFLRPWGREGPALCATPAANPFVVTVVATPIVADVVAGDRDIAGEIMQLQRVRETGVLNEEEFSRAKALVLD